MTVAPDHVAASRLSEATSPPPSLRPRGYADGAAWGTAAGVVVAMVGLLGTSPWDVLLGVVVAALSLVLIDGELQHLEVGTFIPDGPPETECGLYVVELIPERALVLRSNSHLPISWRERPSTGPGHSCSGRRMTVAGPGSTSVLGG